MENMFSVSEMGDCVAVINNNAYVIVADGHGLLPGNIPGFISSYDKYCAPLEEIGETILINVPWSDEEIELSIEDINVKNAVTADELWDMSEEGFYYARILCPSLY